MKKLNPVTTFLLMNGFMAFANSTMFTTYALYYITELGLSPFQLVLVGTFLEITILLFEMPTGVVADTYSRRLSVIIGAFILGTAYVIEGSIPIISETFFHGALSLFIGVIIAEVIRGIGETFLSGAQQAWLADEVGVEEMGPVLLKGNRVYEIASIFGVLASVGLASISLNLPYIMGGVLYLALGVLLLLFMPERNFHRATSEERTSIKETFSTFKNGFSLVRGRTILVAFLFISLFIGAGSEGFDRLWEAHFITSLGFPDIGNLTAPVWFGIISIAANILCFFTAWIAERTIKFETETQVARYMATFTILRLVCIIGFSLAGSFEFALISYLLLMMTGTVTGPLYSTWVNQNIDSRVRATVLSMSSQMNAFGQMLGGPVVGAAASRFTLRIGLTFAAIIQLPILIIYLQAMKRKKSSDQSKPDIAG
ncbi:MFS transporter [Cytobacillus sp. FJAT-54145]|uniref:MFS transporter n=1 Tax=Cytobacillus spartinae TaxID=3299023 RepID=A0ABW6K8G6_9BACI